MVDEFKTPESFELLESLYAAIQKTIDEFKRFHRKGNGEEISDKKALEKLKKLVHQLKVILYGRIAVSETSVASFNIRSLSQSRHKEILKILHNPGSNFLHCAELTFA